LIIIICNSLKHNGLNKSQCLCCDILISRFHSRSWMYWKMGGFFYNGRKYGILPYGEIGNFHKVETKTIPHCHMHVLKDSYGWELITVRICHGWELMGGNWWGGNWLGWEYVMGENWWGGINGWELMGENWSVRTVRIPANHVEIRDHDFRVLSNAASIDYTVNLEPFAVFLEQSLNLKFNCNWNEWLLVMSKCRFNQWKIKYLLNQVCSKSDKSITRDQIGDQVLETFLHCLFIAHIIWLNVSQQITKFWSLNQNFIQNRATAAVICVEMKFFISSVLYCTICGVFIRRRNVNSFRYKRIVAQILKIDNW